MSSSVCNLFLVNERDVHFLCSRCSWLQNYWFTYNEPMKVESVTKAVCNLAMQFGEGEDAEEGALVYSQIYFAA